jgi:hypothetical protein
MEKDKVRHILGAEFELQHWANLQQTHDLIPIMFQKFFISVERKFHTASNDIILTLKIPFESMGIAETSGHLESISNTPGVWLS